MKKLLILILFCNAVYGQRTSDDHLQSLSMAHSLKAPKSSFNKTVDVNNITSIDKSGDMSASLPLITVKGRHLQLPINLSYKAGIKVDQKASSVGLGWNISFGSITRDYGAFEPDYYETSVEIDMPNTETNTIGDLSTNTRSNVVHRKKILTYQGLSGTQKERMTPDLYHVNIPGVQGNTFWNNGAEGAAHNFLWGEFKNWKIDHSAKVYTFNQEFSRINEININTANTNPQTGNVISPYSQSFAAAIAIPPYVQDRFFRKQVFGDGGNASFAIDSNDRIIKYRDFGEFIITTENGTQYVFGRALRGQKYLMQNDPYWSVIHGSKGRINPNDPNDFSTSVSNIMDTNGFVLGELWKIDFIREWLLTEVRSAGYQDTNGNGIADDGDLGDWIRIEYTTPLQQETLVLGNNTPITIDVPKHREWSSFSRTDKESSLMQEQAYVTKIVTPIEEYDLTSSERFDVDHDFFSTPLNNGTSQDFFFAHNNVGNHNTKIKYPVEVMRYDMIKQKERINDQIIKTIQLNYASKGSTNELAVSEYLVLNNSKSENNANYAPNADFGFIFDIEDYKTGGKRGKTTLTGITIYPENDLSSTQAHKYKFEYDYNPSYNPIHKHNIMSMEMYPSLRSSYSRPRFKDKTFIPTLSPFTIDYFIQNRFTAVNLTDNSNTTFVNPIGYYDDPATSSFEGDAWSLTKIVLPQGGSIAFEYEKDETDFTTTYKRLLEAKSLIPNRLPSIMNYNRIAATKTKLQDSINNQFLNGRKKLNPIFKTPEEFYGIRLKQKTINDDNGNISKIDYQYGTGYYTAIPKSYWQNTLSAFSGFMSYQDSNQEGLIEYNDFLKSHTKIFYLVGNGLGGFASAATLIFPGGPIRKNDFNTFVYVLQNNTRFDHTVGDNNHFYKFIDEINSDGAKTRRSYGQLNQVNADFDPIFQNTVYLKGFSVREGDIVEMITNRKSSKNDIFLLSEEKYSSASVSPFLSTEWEYEKVDVGSKYSHFKEGNFRPTRQHVYNYDGGLISIDIPGVTIDSLDDLIDDILNPPTAEVIRITYNIEDYRYRANGDNILYYLSYQEAHKEGVRLKNLTDPTFPGLLEFTDYIIPERTNMTRYCSYHTRLIKKTMTDYRDNTASSGHIEHTTDYFFENNTISFPTRIEESTSENSNIKKGAFTLYPQHYSNTTGFIGSMKNHNLIKPVEIVQYIHDKSLGSYSITGGNYYTYHENGISVGALKSSYSLELTNPVTTGAFIFSNRSAANQIPSNSVQGPFSPDLRYGTKEVETTYWANTNKVKTAISKTGPLISYQYGYKFSLPVTKIVGANTDEVACQNFEDNGYPHDSYSGDKSYYLEAGSSSRPVYGAEAILSNNIQNKNYLLSLWIKTPNGYQKNRGSIEIEVIRNPSSGSPTFLSSGVALPFINDTQGKWKHFKTKIDIPKAKATLGIPSAENIGLRIRVKNTDNYLLIDEWRFHPYEAQVTTYTYKPSRGISSITNERGETQKFEYDGFGRIIMIRDAQGNITSSSEHNIKH